MALVLQQVPLSRVTGKRQSTSQRKARACRHKCDQKERTSDPKFLLLLCTTSSLTSLLLSLMASSLFLLVAALVLVQVGADPEPHPGCRPSYWDWIEGFAALLLIASCLLLIGTMIRDCCRTRDEERERVSRYSPQMAQEIVDAMDDRRLMTPAVNVTGLRDEIAPVTRLERRVQPRSRSPTAIDVTVPPPSSHMPRAMQATGSYQVNPQYLHRGQKRGSIEVTAAQPTDSFQGSSGLPPLPATPRSAVRTLAGKLPPHSSGNFELEPINRTKSKSPDIRPKSMQPLPH